MPIYEYRCNQCQRNTSVLVRSLSSPPTPTCEFCGGSDLMRVMSRFAYHRSEADRLAEVDTSGPAGEDYYRDSRNVGLWAKKRAKELGVDDVLKPQFDEIVDNAHAKVKDMLSD